MNARVPSLHEMWNWEGDTSVLPHKVTEIMNSVSVFNAEDPQFQSDDPFDFERPYKSDNIRKIIDTEIKNGTFDTNSFIFVTYRS